MKSNNLFHKLRLEIVRDFHTVETILSMKFKAGAQVISSEKACIELVNGLRVKTYYVSSMINIDRFLAGKDFDEVFFHAPILPKRTLEDMVVSRLIMRKGKMVTYAKEIQL